MYQLYISDELYRALEQRALEAGFDWRDDDALCFDHVERYLAAFFCPDCGGSLGNLRPHSNDVYCPDCQAEYNGEEEEEEEEQA
ncbi:hypothetical protein [Helicobacter vulpis]|uniref:hypothetical protein n=1 Tax=Helicobacter vulpis TaxID=2316076 RepID=UPI000EAD8EA3|nr:hypothetical protein [Helicobacter vulpis]